jgi:ABC-type multidrug transport system ATPase subunit
MMRLYELKDGSITIGGKNIAAFGLDRLRASIAYVPQEAVLFDNSVAYNVAYYSSLEVDPLKIMLACADAAIHREIMKMPICYDTGIGEKGFALSGGQRQRLSIARAVLTDPNIVILDEVTSNLDAINASEVEETIAHFTKNRTAISITHDAKEISEADYAVVMEGGTVVEQGPPRALLKRKGKLSALMRSKAYSQVRNRQGEGSAINTVARHIASATQIAVSKGSRRSLLCISYKGRRFRDLTPQFPFPITHPEVIIFNDRKEKPILLINDRGGLDRKDAGVLDNAISVTNFKPTILQISSVRMTGDGLEWFVKTNRGKSKIRTETRRSVRDLGKKLVLIDKDGSVFEAERSKLDARSQKIIEGAI